MKRVRFGKSICRKHDKFTRLENAIWIFLQYKEERKVLVLGIDVINFARDKGDKWKSYTKREISDSHKGKVKTRTVYNFFLQLQSNVRYGIIIVLFSIVCLF